MRFIPADVGDLKDLAPDELKAMCRVLEALLAFCGDVGARDDRFDRDELGVPPEEDYDDELEE